MTSTRSAPRLKNSTLKTLRGMIIDRHEAWRADAEMAPVIESAIRQGLRNIDSETRDRIYGFLRYGPRDEDGFCQPLPGSYETYGFDEKQMAKAWRKYLKKYGMEPVKV